MEIINLISVITKGLDLSSGITRQADVESTIITEILLLGDLTIRLALASEIDLEEA